jgi:hypothetical protein
MTQLERTIEIYRSIESPVWEGDHLCGLVRVGEPLNSFVSEYEDDFEVELKDEQGLIISNDDLGKYDSLQIKFLPPRKVFSFFAKDFDDYLEHFNFLYKQADEFYIADIDGLYNNGDSSNNQIKAYSFVVSLYELLLRVADHTEKEGVSTHRHIILSVSGKEDIPVIYSSQDIVRLSEHLRGEQIENIEEELFSLPHKSSKLSLFKKSISQYLSGNNSDSKFSILIEQLLEIYKNYKNNYELFLHEFSFEDEKEKLEQKKQEYLLKLNDILNGIHGKLLAVPISLVIVAGQMKASTVDNYLLTNLIILVGAFVFALLMWLLTANQLHSLLAIKTEYSAKKKRLKIEFRNSLYEELDLAFIQLDARFKHQRRLIRVIDYLVLFGLLFSLIVFEYHTQFIAGLI